MTNVVDAVVVYTNMVFQLMAGEANHAINAFQLPLPQPITANVVSDFRIASTGTNAEGSLTVSNFTFVFSRGYLERFYNTSSAPLWENTGLLQLSFQIMRSASPEDPEMLRIAALRLEAAGIPGGKLEGGGCSRLLTNYFSRGRFLAHAMWRTPDFNVILQGDSSSHQIEGGFFSSNPHPFQSTQLKVGSIQETKPEFVISQEVIPCGSATPTVETVRAAMKKCYAEIKAKLNGRPAKALLVGENLNSTWLIDEEARRLGQGAQVGVLSIPWKNPPFFPAKIADRYIAKARGVVMIALTGEPDVRLMNLDFLKRANFTHSESDLTPAETNQLRMEVTKFLAETHITGPKPRNALVVLPVNGYSPVRAQATETLSGDILSIQGTEFGDLTALPDRYITVINGQARTNSPFALLFRGRFPMAYKRIEFNPNPANPLLIFHENRLVSTFERLGETCVRILLSATNAEIFRLYSRADKVPAGLPQFEGRSVKKRAGRGGQAAVEAVANEILAPTASPGFGGASACIFDPGLGFRLQGREGSVSALVCLGCGRIEWTVRDPAEKELSNGSNSLDGASKKALAQAGLKGLPGDPALLKVADR